MRVQGLLVTYKKISIKIFSDQNIFFALSHSISLVLGM